MAFKGPMSVRKAIAIGCATITLAVAGGLAIGHSAEAGDAQFRAELRDVRGQSVGTVKFRITRHDMHVDARLWPNSFVTPGQFHGFHVHANNDPANGVGCVADRSAPAVDLVRLRRRAPVRQRPGPRQSQRGSAESARAPRRDGAHLLHHRPDRSGCSPRARP